MILLIAILTALTLVTASAAVYQFQTRNRKVADRLQRVVDGDLDADAPVPDSTLIEENLPVGAHIVGFFAWLFPTQVYSEMLQWELARAGFRNPGARKVFTGARVLSTAAIGIAGAALSLHFGSEPLELFFFTLVAGAVGYYAPVAWLRQKQGKRQEAITVSLPDALDLLVICVEAGQGLNAALLKVGRECEFSARELSDELKTVNNEMVAGVSRQQALRNFALRTGVEDVRALVAVMVQSDRFGTSIASALRIHAASLRTRRRQRAEEAARKTPVKLVFPLVFCIFPELLVVILAPGMLALFRALSKMAQ